MATAVRTYRVKRLVCGQLLSKSPWPRAAPTVSLAPEQAIDGLPRQTHDAGDLGDAPSLAAKLANHFHLLLGRLVGHARLAAAPGALAAVFGPLGLDAGPLPFGPHFRF